MSFVMIIPADQRKPVRCHPTKREPSLCRLQRMVGGYIEVVPHWFDYMGTPCAVYCNEEGKQNGLPPNRRATTFWYQKLFEHAAVADSLSFGDFLVGNVVLCVGFEEDAENA
jgi:hypothetical protein